MMQRTLTSNRCSVQGAAPTLHVRPAACCSTAVRPRRHALKLLAYKEPVDHSKENISTKDWRTQDMVTAAKKFSRDIWSHGNLDVCDALLADNFVLRESVWAPQRPFVGPQAMKDYVAQWREAYPDYQRETDYIGVCDANRIFVYWHSNGTNLRPVQDTKGTGKVHRPTYHSSQVSGIDLMVFSDDRSRITEVTCFRQPTHEEMDFVEEEAMQHNQPEIVLERLHFDRRDGPRVP